MILLNPGILKGPKTLLVSPFAKYFCKRNGIVRHISNETSILRTDSSASQQKKIDTTPLKLSNELYAIFRIHNRPYVVTKGDKVILPFKMKQADVGDTLHLTDVITLGSRNYKMVEYPIDRSLYTLTATVLEKTKRKFHIREVTKRRNRRVRHAKSKGDLTVIRISELKVH
ncbi:hypothetical protein KAFR_0A01410 [Kazachstania africana CBS 2517]|uniref:Large ribosomal subunit protein bL21m n=1 Tax=Kazachstania africana (strain ATCC 22294 / BCRC 22015 / CBS 2517 / CECT 1963 / NBRC 1671 / NRRL Y-8276) TaxID=1071382 RepID=H2AMH9_KAZAF|nr:hypothetical protein KAFR_0A01410 [Kazachstania africana CBS 2517]CCF55579.1 hypothetical protein KAFR_0A01410 [Kazachstania africana CBS 2517]